MKTIDAMLNQFNIMTGSPIVLWNLAYAKKRVLRFQHVMYDLLRKTTEIECIGQTCVSPLVSMGEIEKDHKRLELQASMSKKDVHKQKDNDESVNITEYIGSQYPASGMGCVFKGCAGSNAFQ